MESVTLGLAGRNPQSAPFFFLRVALRVRVRARVEEERPDPFELDREGSRRWVRGRVGRAWLVETGGPIAFVGYVDVQRPEGWLLRGVYTRPEACRRGLARAGRRGAMSVRRPAGYEIAYHGRQRAKADRAGALRGRPAAAGEAMGAYLWTNAKVLAVDVSVSRDVAQAFLPEALSLAEPATATLFVADYPETAFGSVYREAAVLLHAGDDRGPALHCSWMVVDDDTALILGREVLGFPKKMAEIQLEEREGRAVGTVSRKGVELMRLEATIGEAETNPAPFFARRMVNAIGTLPTGMKRIDLPPAEEHIHSARVGEAKVALASSDRDPLADLRPAASGSARLVHLDFGSLAAAAGGGQSEILGDAGADWTLRHFFYRAR